MIVVDRIEGTRAILEVDGETVEIPASALPEGAGEGAILRLVAEPPPVAATEVPPAPPRAPRKVVL